MLSAGGIEILNAYERYRVLQTQDLSRWTGRSGQVLRRYKRNVLIPEGYIVSLGRRSMQDPMAYALGSRGREWIAEKRKVPPALLPFSKTLPDIQSLFFRHTMMTVRIGMAFDLATRGGAHPHLNLDRLAFEWEMDPAHLRSKDKAKKQVLRAWVYDPADRKKKNRMSLRPDALVVLRHHEDDAGVAAYIEADRGGESVSSVIETTKYEPYKIWHQTGGYRRDAAAMRVLFVLDTKRHHRIATMQRQLQAIARRLGDPHPEPNVESPASWVWDFRFTRAELLNQETAIDGPVWWNYRDADPVPLFNPLARDKEEAA